MVRNMTADRQRIVLTFDIGTQSARALLIDQEGHILAKKQKKYELAYLSEELGAAGEFLI